MYLISRLDSIWAGDEGESDAKMTPKILADVSLQDVEKIF
jgi:hypothetical protein